VIAGINLFWNINACVKYWYPIWFLTIETMDFHEDLEDLIQSDLHTEMNKILDQSESETCQTTKVNTPIHVEGTAASNSKLQNSTSLLSSL